MAGYATLVCPTRYSLPTTPSYSAQAEYPVRRSFSVRSLTPRNTGSPAFAGDDGRECGAFIHYTRSRHLAKHRGHAAGLVGGLGDMDTGPAPSGASSDVQLYIGNDAG